MPWPSTIAPSAHFAEAAKPATAIARPNHRPDAALWAASGQEFLTGTRALLRLALLQRARDAAAGLATQGFISGYRGSPLGQVDQTIWKAGERAAIALGRIAAADSVAPARFLGCRRRTRPPMQHRRTRRSRWELHT